MDFCMMQNPTYKVTYRYQVTKGMILSCNFIMVGIIASSVVAKTITFLFILIA